MRLWVPLAIFMLFHACSSLQSGSGSQRDSNNRRQWSLTGSFRRLVSGLRQSRPASRTLTPAFSTSSYRSDHTHGETSAQGASGPGRNSQRRSPPGPSSRSSPHARPQAPTVGDLATDGMLFTVQAISRDQVPDVDLRRGAEVTVNPQPPSPRQALQLFTKEKYYNRVTLLSVLRWVIFHLNDAAGPPMLVEISFGRVPPVRKMRWIRRTAFGNPSIDSGIPIRRLPESFESLNNWLFVANARNNIERAQNPPPPPPLQVEQAPDDRRVSSSDPNACHICFSHAKKIWIKPCNHRTCKSCILTIRKEAVEAQGYINAPYKCPFCKRFVEEWKEDGPYPESNPNAS